MTSVPVEGQDSLLLDCRLGFPAHLLRVARHVMLGGILRCLCGTDSADPVVTGSTVPALVSMQFQREGGDG